MILTQALFEILTRTIFISTTSMVPLPTMDTVGRKRFLSATEIPITYGTHLHNRVFLLVTNGPTEARTGAPG